MPAFTGQPEVRRHAVLKHFQPYDAVAGVDSFGVVMMMVMVVIVALLDKLPLPPGSPHHPQGDADDQHGGRHLKIGFTGFSIPLLTEVHPAERDDPHHGRVGNRRRQPEQNGLRHRATNGHDERGHHGL